MQNSLIIFNAQVTISSEIQHPLTEELISLDYYASQKALQQKNCQLKEVKGEKMASSTELMM